MLNISLQLSSDRPKGKERKVILVEHPLLPLYIKEMISKILFENLLVREVVQPLSQKPDSFSPRFLLCHLRPVTFFHCLLLDELLVWSLTAAIKSQPSFLSVWSMLIMFSSS